MNCYTGWDLGSLPGRSVYQRLISRTFTAGEPPDKLIIYNEHYKRGVQYNTIQHNTTWAR